MLIHQGVDIVAVSKIREIMLRRPGFGDEVFTEREREYCLARPNPYIHFAGRFAAKEACLKALGTGLSATGIDGSLGEIEIIPGKSGKPELHLAGWTGRIVRRKKISQLTVSISHSADYAVALVIMAGNGTPPTVDNGARR
ncbi:MAG: holo-ACP synthase [Syntrophobacteraceae bacterium]